MVGICYVAPDIPVPGPRGASTHVLELARALHRLGNQVHVVCRRERFQSGEESISGVTFHRIYRGVLFPLPNAASRDGSSSWRSGAVSAAYSWHLRSLNALFAGFFSLRLVKRYRLQVIIERETAFGAGAVASMLSDRPMVLELIGPKVSRLSASASSRILAYSEVMVPAGSMDKTSLVKAAVNPDIFHPDGGARSRVRSRLGLNGSTVVGYVGTFQAWLGLDTLLEAALTLEPWKRGIKFLLVGPVPEEVKARATERMKGSAVFTGPVPYERVAEYINASDVAVAPYCTLNTSREKTGIGSPLKVLEYMACGKPTVGSSLPQVADIIDDGVDGLLFPQGDADALASKILLLAEDRDLRDAMGGKALEKAVSQFTWGSFARRLHSDLEDCIRARAA